LTAEIRNSLRDLSLQLSLLNQQVSAHIEIRPGDLSCLEVISRRGPLSPSALARHSGQHPATITGILDRLERAGWIARERDPGDRRAVVVRSLRERSGEIVRHYSGMNSAVGQILASYADDQLGVLADFLRRTADAGRTATDDLASED
jgi:DNA-binding MarR family transcriptional regulator